MNEPTQLMSPADMQSLAESAAKSGMFGITNAAQAMCLFAICQAEGMNPVMALKKYHIIEGKPSERSDYMLADFLSKGGGVMWHSRRDDTAAATFFEDAKKMDEKAIERAKTRYVAIMTQDMRTEEECAHPGEGTIVRTMKDADAKGLSMCWKENKEKKWERVKKTNWAQSPRQMLTARVITEGIRLIAPGIVAGVASPEDIEDSREAITDTAEAPQALPDRDLAAMQAILRQHEQDALAALQRKDEREAKRLQGLASDMRIAIEEKSGIAERYVDMDPAKDNNREVVTAADLGLRSTAKPEPDDIPMNHATDIPKDCKMVKGSEIPQPKKKPPVPETPPAVPPAEEKPPVPEQASEPASWREYVIQRIPSFKGRSLGSLTDVERKTLCKKRGTAALPEVFAKNPGLEPQQKAEIEEDAKWIDLAAGGGK